MKNDDELSPLSASKFNLSVPWQMIIRFFSFLFSKKGLITLSRVPRLNKKSVGGAIPYILLRLIKPN